MNLKKAKLKYNIKSVELSYEVLKDALTKFGEKVDIPRVMFITPDQYAQLRKDKQFLALKDISGKPLMMSGVIGELCGVKLVVTANLEITTSDTVLNLIVEAFVPLTPVGKSKKGLVINSCKIKRKKNCRLYL